MTEKKDAEEFEFHKPVLVEEVLAYLDIASKKILVDATLGGGGHSLAMLKAAGADSLLIGIDRDLNAIEFANKKLGEFGARFKSLHGRMSDIAAHLKMIGVEKVDAILADLGVSSFQLDEATRGFSFMRDGPLDMRMDRACGESASELIARCEKDELESIIREYGEERFAARIAGKIAGMNIATTGELARMVRDAQPPIARRGKIHPATRTFQALRIFVNDELGELKNFLESAPQLLKKNGRLVIISYHSLEDRMIKRKFRELAKQGEFSLPVKRVVIAEDEEVRENPRARSAKLRVIERV